MKLVDRRKKGNVMGTDSEIQRMYLGKCVKRGETTKVKEKPIFS